MHESVTSILGDASALRAEVAASDELARLSDPTVDILRASGGMRLLQAKDLGGFEAHPNDFLDWVMAVGREHPSAGWVAGVVGVHPWEISIMDERVQEEIYGDGSRHLDRLAVRPVRPGGAGRRRLPVQWPVALLHRHGPRRLGDPRRDGRAAQTALRSSLPTSATSCCRAPTTAIVPDSWNVMGLRGTGSKDVVVENAFVPAHRVVDAARMYDGSYARERRPESPLFAMMFGLMFPAAIAAGTFGIARAAVRCFAEAMEGRVSVVGRCRPDQPGPARAPGRRRVRRRGQHQPGPLRHRRAVRARGGRGRDQRPATAAVPTRPGPGHRPVHHRRRPALPFGRIRLDGQRPPGRAGVA